MARNNFIYWFADLDIRDVPIVGGKNASLGEMFSNLTIRGIRIPSGFAISAHAYNHFVESTGIKEKIVDILKGLDGKNIKDLAKRGKNIRDLIRSVSMSKELANSITDAYEQLGDEYKTKNVDVAIRSSATAEDLPDASFAGQQESYLNVKGNKCLLTSCRNCFASLFTNRAIAYRQEKKFDHFSVSLSIAVQKMVRSDLASAGVMFSIDTESGFKDAIYITGGYGLGENVVQGAINPDEWYVHKPSLSLNKKAIIYSLLGAKQKRMVYLRSRGIENKDVPQAERDQFCLSDDDVYTLAKWAKIIEDHYSQEAGYRKPMDIEWAKDGKTGELFIVQARPETVISRRDTDLIHQVKLEKTSRILCSGMAVGDYVGSGQACVLRTARDINMFKKGMVLVTEITDPDWVPIMNIASAIVTELGGRTSHAAIISRELGIPCIVGAEGATNSINDRQEITVSCAGGSKGVVYDGLLPFKEETVKLSELKMPSLSLMFHQAKPDQSFSDARYPNEGVGLLRVDELLSHEMPVHPLAIINYPYIDDKNKLDEISVGFPDKKDFFLRKLSQMIAQIAASVYPKPTRVLLSDATSDQMSRLIGGTKFTEIEKNPLLGARGVSRYQDLDYEKAFQLELQAIVRARNELGQNQIELILPATQSPKETQKLLDILSNNKLRASKDNLNIHLLIRTPCQIYILEELKNLVDGIIFSVADIAQLAQGTDANNILARDFYDEKHPAVLSMLEHGIRRARELNLPAVVSNISAGNLSFFAHWRPLQLASALVVRPNIFPTIRKELLEADKAG